MNISALAKVAGISTDTLRYYEKQGLIAAAPRQANGYRSYTDAHLALLRFIRGAQALGFSLTEIRAILPLLAEGKLGRPEIELRLQQKMAQIDQHMAQLQTLKSELAATFAALSCSPGHPVSTEASTASDSGSGAGVAVQRRCFAQTSANEP